MDPHMNDVEEQEPAQNVMDNHAWAPVTFPSTPIGEFLTIAAPKAKFYMNGRNLFTGSVFNSARPGGLVELLTVPVNPKMKEEEELREPDHVLSMAFPDDIMREAAQTALAHAESFRDSVDAARAGGYVSDSEDDEA